MKDHLDSWDLVKPILAEILDADPTEREVIIARTCGGDTKLLEHVRVWLAAHDQSADFIEKSAFSVDNLGISSIVGREIGNYKIIRELGHGGMGAVYLGERCDGQFEQRVALKVVRQSLAEPYLVERFKSERQILASLDHPHIARLLDGGVTETGEPFFVMEYVEGEGLLHFAQKGTLDTRSRLRLFLEICSALSYAHRNLVIHRDIKPGNILVTSDGGTKLLDFGLAKLLPDHISPADATQTAFRALTPAYASPEQLSNRPITTSTDIYSLGVVLFELLTGAKPFSHDGNSLEDISRTVDSREAPLASSLGNNSLRGDIDNIIRTALRREPERRYESVAAFAADIERYLDGLPVHARPSTVRYKTSKFIRRHRIGVASAALVLLALLGGITVSLSQARKAERERAKATAVNDFLQSMLGYTDTSNGLVSAKSHETTVNDVLRHASTRLGSGELSDEPETKAELQRIIGSSYLTQGRYEEAETNLRSSLELKSQIYGPQSTEVLPILVELAQLYVSTSRFPDAEKIYEQRLSIVRTAEKDGSIDPTYLMVALNDYAVLRRAEGDSAAAEVLMRECLSTEPRMPPESSMVVGVAKSVYALVLTDSGRFDEAETIIRQRVESIRGLPDPGTIELAASLTALGGILIEKGESREALGDLTEAENIFRKLTGPRHLPLGDNLRSQARAYLDIGDLDQAQAKIAETLEIYRQSSRPNFLNYPTALGIEAEILLKQGRIADADTAIAEAMTLRERDLPAGHFMTAVSRETRAQVRMLQGRRDEAFRLIDQSLSELQATQVPASRRIAKAQDLKAAFGGVSGTQVAAR